ncbi:iron(III) ABC transporter ATP-binding protein [Geotalea uraniireducens]|uniref:Iron(III) ABC transporter ATP-binding protein n=1 Tax=Geotalea uraniireducens TaxID=351604 RepID=A0ABM8EIG6_9BACT|nr:ABC transporter ATP-binding protein [Geotalea uraniireducens]BDV42193.1 iron(III) ABC transporter ATP-binding protein [Geotalea uraniireducens]
MAPVSLEDVSFRYRRQPVIERLNLACGDGGVLALLGPNGSGKTTLLKLLLGILEPSSGRVRLDGRDLRRIPARERARRLAYVPQVHREAFGYRVFDVVLMGRMPHSGFLGRYGVTDRRLAGEALERLGIGHLAERPYTEVSGGERQLALIARALAQGARTLVLDEPTNGLDYGNQQRLLDRLARLRRDGYSCIFTTHHPDHARRVADRVVMLRRGEIVRDGAPGEIVTAAGVAALYGLEPDPAADHAQGDARCFP